MEVLHGTPLENWMIKVLGWNILICGSVFCNRTDTFLSIQRKWKANHINFENRFPNGHLKRQTYVEIPVCKSSKQERDKNYLRFGGVFMGYETQEEAEAS